MLSVDNELEAHIDEITYILTWLVNIKSEFKPKEP